MTKIKLMGVREEDEPYIELWSQQHEVEVEMSKEQLTEDNVQSIEGCDGLSLSQTLPLSETIYNKLRFKGSGYWHGTYWWHCCTNILRRISM